MKQDWILRFAVGMAIGLAAIPGGATAATRIQVAAYAGNPVVADIPIISFKGAVLPIFKSRCFICHEPGGEGFRAIGLDLQTYKGVMKGSRYGVMVVPGKPGMSNLMRLLDWHTSPGFRMPLNGKKLSAYERDTIRIWIEQGAKDN